MDKYRKAIYNLSLLMKNGSARDTYEEEVYNLAMEVLERENKTLDYLDTAFACEKCGQISSSKDINSVTEDCFKDRNLDIKSIEDVGTSFSEFVCPKCNRRLIGKDFKRLK